MNTGKWGLFKKLLSLTLTLIMMFQVFILVSAEVPSVSPIVVADYGVKHGIALHEDGTVSQWGTLVDGSVIQTPEKVPALSNITEIACGYYHSIALDKDGFVWVWGDNSWMYPEENPRADVYAPVRVSELDNVIAIDAGDSYFLALKKDGTVWSLGVNYFGQLGDGTTNNSRVPVMVSSLSGVKSIACGKDHSVAVTDTKRLFSWGNNEYGQSMRGTNGGIYIKALSSYAFNNVVKADAGDGFTIVMLDDNTIWESGRGELGQLGNGMSIYNAKPVQVTFPSMVLKNSGVVNTIINIKAGINHCVALMKDSTLYGWGDNGLGQIGQVVSRGYNVPQLISNTKSAMKIAAGGNNSGFIKADGKLWTIGDNSSYQAGNGRKLNQVKFGIVSGLSNISSVASNGSFSLAQSADHIYTWGRGTEGQLGNENYFSLGIPTVVTGSNYSLIKSGKDHALALKADGTVWAWGDNSFGQLGTGDYQSYSIPVKVKGLDGITNISAGSFHNLALKNDGTLWAWGRNGSWQLGDGSGLDQVLPVEIKGVIGIVNMACGTEHSVVITSDGSIWSWGTNEYQQLGSTVISATIPSKITGVSNICDIACGVYHTIAVDKTGIVWSFGDNSHGQLGIGSMYRTGLPSEIGNLSKISKVYAGMNQSIAIDSEHKVWVFGSNQHYELGNEKNEDISIPTSLQGISAKSAACGEEHTVILGMDGMIYTSGSNQFGQLGDQDEIAVLTPRLNSVFVRPLNQVKVAINTFPVVYDVNPVIESGRTLIPARGTFEKMGATVSWDAPTRTVTCTRGDTTIIMVIDKPIATVNGENVTMEVPPRIVQGGRTLVPLRFMSESLGAFVDWDGESRTAIIAD